MRKSHAHPVQTPASGDRRARLAGWARALLLVVCVGLAATPPPATAQDNGDQVATQYPGPFEATSRYRVLQEEAALAEERIEALSETGVLEDDLERMQERLVELRSLLAGITEAEYARPERLARVRDQAVQAEQDLEVIRQQAADALQELEELRARWASGREFWDGWRAALRDQQRLQPVQDEFRGASQRIEEVIDALEAVIPDLLETQQAAAALRAEAERVAQRVMVIRSARRELLLQRGEPILFSPTYFSALFSEWDEWRPVDTQRMTAHVSFLRASAPLILLHLLLIVGFALLARRLQTLSIPEQAWTGLLLRPRALAVFAVTAALAGRYELAPAFWDVLMWFLLASSGAILATRLLRAAPLRAMVYFFAGLYPVFLLLEAVGTPPPVFRPLLAGAALVGLVLFGFHFQRSRTSEETGAWVTWSLGIGVLVWVVVLLAELLGFYLLTRWILHATVTTAYAVFVVVFLIVLARGATRTLVRLEAKDRTSFLRSIGAPLMERLLKLFQLVLVVLAVLHVLDIWELTPSPAETWQSVAGVGFTVAGIEITLGRVLAAGLLVYFAVLLSWIVRTFTRSEVYPRWQLERGVGDSINALVHYFMITVGVLIGLGALGVELQNFAIIAGALGVGIGFGLQNIVNNFVSGLILLFERPVRVGDTIVIASELGTIQKIGLRSTTVVTFDKAEVIVPNGDLVSEKVTNWTLTDPVARLILPVGVAYGTNVSRVLEILSEVAASHPDVLDEPAPQALFMSFGDSALDFELRVWVQDLRLRLLVRSSILAEIDRLFRESGIEIPFPQRDLHLRSIDAAIFDAASRRIQGPAGDEGASPV
jgi:potassium-dependent mechanosensitive channel